MRLGALVVLVFLVAAGNAQFQPEADWDGLVQRDELTAAGQLEGAKRVLRFVHVSDAHILDDDAPYPLRQEPLDPLGPPFASAQRPQEEYTDEVLDAMIRQINARHALDAFDFVLNTGDNIDNQLENELMRFIDNWEGTLTTRGPISGLECVPDGQSASVDDDSQDAVDRCTHLALPINTPLAPGLPWFSAFGNHDGLVQGNAPLAPGFNEIAAEHGRHFLQHSEYVQMHFEGAQACRGGLAQGSFRDDFGHGFGFAGPRLCDDDPDNDGYYAFSSRGVRFVVLDTINDDFVAANGFLADVPTPHQLAGHDVVGGYHDGAVDPEQFEWLMREVTTHADQLVIVASHHTVNSMFSKNAEDHCLEVCLDLAEAGYRTGPELVAALSEHPHVVAWIGGHTHAHKVEPKGGFWNIETSSLIDMPQESRVIEVWITADGAKGFLAMTRLSHDFEKSRELGAADPQADPAAAGTPEDQDVILWFDVPESVDVRPQPSLPRFLVATQVEPNATVKVGENVTLRLHVHDSRFGVPVDGLQVKASIDRADAEAATGVAFVARQTLEGVGGGDYVMRFIPEAPHIHFVKYRIHDETGNYPELLRSTSIAVDDVVEESAKKSPAPALWLALAAVLWLRRRQ